MLQNFTVCLYRTIAGMVVTLETIRLVHVIFIDVEIESI